MRNKKGGIKVDKRCICGGEFIYQGYDNIEIEEDGLVISGECECRKCGIEAYYKEYHDVDLSKPYLINIDTNVDEID